MQGLIGKDQFIGLDGIAHLGTGGEPPVLRSHIGAAAEFLFDKGSGMPGRDRMAAVADRAKLGLSRHLNGRPDDIAFLNHAAEGIFVAATGIDWRSGDNVVTAGAEYPTVVHGWRVLAESGVEIRTFGTAIVPTIDELRAAVDRRTRVIAASHVSYLTGMRYDLAALREIADTVDARVVIDASHGLGVVPVDGSLCDVVVSCCYKYLLGTHGIGVFYLNSRRWPDLRPSAIGWHSIVRQDDWRSQRSGCTLKTSAERFEIGNPSYISAYILDNALTTMAPLAVADIERHVLAVGGMLRDRLVKLGLDVLTPASERERAGNIAFATDRSETLEAALRKAGVITWSGGGRLRLSVHAFNDDADVARAMSELEKFA
jgi:cysteine desulfurase/selenocysteine lyase